jgi:hypothetical protein
MASSDKCNIPNWKGSGLEEVLWLPAASQEADQDDDGKGNTQEPEQHVAAKASFMICEASD